MTTTRRECGRLLVLVGLLANVGCVAAWRGGSRALPPVPRGAASGAAAAMRARVWRTEKAADVKEYPEGTRHVHVVLEVGGLRFDHNEFHVPAGKDAKRRWDFAKAALPDGTTLIGDSLNWHSGQRGYSPWSFLGVHGRLPGAKAPVNLLKPSVCVAAAAFEGDGWAAVELVFERPIDAGRAVRLAVRLKRVAGDPWVALQFQAEPAGASIERVSIGGYPNHPHPIWYGLRTRWPRAAPFLRRERWVWAAGEDWNMHDGQRTHSAAVGADAPGGVVFYNRHNSEMGGMLAVFLPEQVREVSAAGTYGVRVSLALRAPRLRLALREWYDVHGWGPVRREFLAELPQRARRLRRTSFAWPITDLLGSRDRARVQALLGARLPQAGKDALAAAQAAYQAAAERLRAAPLGDSPRRCAAERAVIVAASRVREAMTPLVREWLAKGGVFAGAE